MHIVHLILRFDDCVSAEKYLLSVFNEKFILFNGRETFTGDLNEMLDIIYEFHRKCRPTLQPPKHVCVCGATNCCYEENKLLQDWLMNPEEFVIAVKKKLGQKQILNKPEYLLCFEKNTNWPLEGCQSCTACVINNTLFEQYRASKEDRLKFDYDAQDNEAAISDNKKIADIFNECLVQHCMVFHSWKGGISSLIVSKEDYKKYDYWDSRIASNVVNGICVYPYKRIEQHGCGGFGTVGTLLYVLKIIGTHSAQKSNQTF
jgi:hypothetical protein